MEYLSLQKNVNLLYTLAQIKIFMSTFTDFISCECSSQIVAIVTTTPMFT